MKPLIYGYLRVTEDLEDDELQHLERGIEKLAEAEGFCIPETRYEHQPGYYTTFYQLTAELKQAQESHLIVPSLDHLSTHPLLREQMLMRLGEADVRMWVVEA
jgi:hypothetical protein